MGSAKRILLTALTAWAAAHAGPPAVPGLARRAANACPEVGADMAHNLMVQTPGLRYTVTNFDPSWFDTDHPERAPTLFIMTINPNLATQPYANQLRLHLRVLADTSRGRQPSTALVAFDRLSEPIPLVDIGPPIKSGDVFNFTWQPNGTSFKDSPLFDYIVANHTAPEMDLIFQFGLTCEDQPVSPNTIVSVPVDSLGGDIGHLRFVKMIRSLYPGTQITNPNPVSIYTVTPIFQVASELFNTHEYQYPPDEPPIEIFIYELPTGTNPKDALDGLEYAKFGVFKDSPSPYPANLPLLRPGMTYIWRARALLNGPTSDYLYSDPLYFKVDERLEGGSSIPASEVSDLTTLEDQVKYGDDYQKRVMAALKIILGDNFEIFDLSRAGKVPAKGQIRLNGHPYSLEELERLAREFHQSHQSVTRLRFQ